MSHFFPACLSAFLVMRFFESKNPMVIFYYSAVVLQSASLHHSFLSFLLYMLLFFLFFPLNQHILIAITSSSCPFSPSVTPVFCSTDKADTIKASYIHSLSSSSSVGAEIAHKISKNDITFTAGASYKLDDYTTSKFRLNNRGSIAAVLQHEFRPKSTFTISGEVDSKALEKSAKVGFALSLKP